LAREKWRSCDYDEIKDVPTLLEEHPRFFAIGKNAEK
jgi:hypothetical protein